MAKYNIYGIVTGTKFIGQVEADSPEEAEELGLSHENNHISICHYCSNDLSLDDFSCSEVIVEEADEV